MSLGCVVGLPECSLKYKQKLQKKSVFLNLIQILINRNACTFREFEASEVYLIICFNFCHMVLWIVPTLNLVTNLEIWLWERYPVLIWRLLKMKNHCAWKSFGVLPPISFIKAELLVPAVPFGWVNEYSGSSTFSSCRCQLTGNFSLHWQTKLSSQALRCWNPKCSVNMMHWSSLNILSCFRFAQVFLTA